MFRLGHYQKIKCFELTMDDFLQFLKVSHDHINGSSEYCNLISRKKTLSYVDN